jgi:uncharacterized protein (DUF1330 family)
MAKGYWVTFYRSIADPAALAEYGKLAVPAIQAGGGRILTRGMPAKAYEVGLPERAVVIEFDSVAQAIATYEGPAYQAALRVLDGAAERDLRILEGTT